MKAIIEKIESIVDNGETGTITYKFLSIPVFRTTKTSNKGIELHPPKEGELLPLYKSQQQSIK